MESLSWTLSLDCDSVSIDVLCEGAGELVWYGLGEPTRKEG